MANRLNLVFCGTPDFAVPTLNSLINHPAINLRAIVTMPDRPAGRGQKLQAPPVALFAKENSIPLIQTSNINGDNAFLDLFNREKIDLVIVLAFAQFLSGKVLSLPKYGCFNIHTSLLPKYRGAAPIQHAILNGEKETGVSIQKMVKEMDAGDVVHYDIITIGTEETALELHQRLQIQAAISVQTFINKLLENSLTVIKQDPSAVSYAPSLKKEDGLIHFSSDTFISIKNKVRALNPWPGTYCYINSKRLKILEIQKDPLTSKAGEINTSYHSLLVGCADATIRLTKVQLEGKKVCSDTEFLNGFKFEHYEVNP